MNQDVLSKLQSLLRSFFSITLFIVLLAFIGFSSWQLLVALIGKFS